MLRQLQAFQNMWYVFNFLFILKQFAFKSDLILTIFQIQFDRRFIGDSGNVALISIDGTHFMINKPIPFSEKWFSHKFNGPGLSYEIGICIATGDIVWYNGPFQASVPDITIFRSKLKGLLLPGEKALGDGTYLDIKCVSKKDGLNYIHRRAMARTRARHESINRRLKQFKCLGSRYRHDLKKHHLVFQAVITLTQLDIDIGNIPFQINTYSQPAFVEIV